MVRGPIVLRSIALKVLPALAGVWLASSASAATLDGVTIPDVYTVNGQTLKLNGAGVRTLTIFRIRVYVAALYLLRPSHDAGDIVASPGTKVVRLAFIRSGSKAQIEKQFREGEANNCGHGECEPGDEADFERLVEAAPAVEPGDTFTYVFTDRGVKAFANNNLIGDFADVDLAHHLLLGFIGKNPPSESLRDHLLGVASD